MDYSLLENAFVISDTWVIVILSVLAIASGILLYKEKVVVWVLPVLVGAIFGLFVDHYTPSSIKQWMETEYIENYMEQPMLTTYDKKDPSKVYVVGTHQVKSDVIHYRKVLLPVYTDEVSVEVQRKTDKLIKERKYDRERIVTPHWTISSR